MASTTIDNETELSAVNAILGAIGQSPVTAINKTNPEIGFIYNLLRDSNVDVQSEGWHFNTERHVKYTPQDVGGIKKIAIGNDILKMDVTDGWSKRNYDVVKRNGYLYDKYDHTDDWDELTDDTDITVQLTSIGNACQHFVKSVSKEKIEVGCDCGKPHYYFIVHAQRFNEGRLDILKPKTTKGL